MKKKLSILAVLLLAVTISAYSVGGTYAKYTTTASVTGTAPVAKWAVALKSGNTVFNGTTTTFDLIGTRKDTKDDAAETDVVADKIAPGTYGDFALEVDGTNTEVTYNYSISFTVANPPANLKFYSDEDMTSELTAVNDVYSLDGTVAHDAASKDNTLQVYWKWAYEVGEGAEAIATNDGVDTELGTTPVSMVVTATLTATQVD